MMQIVALPGQFNFSGSDSVSVGLDLMRTVVALSGQFRIAGTGSTSVIEQAIRYIVVALPASFHFTGGSVVFRRVIPKPGRKSK